MSRKNEAKLAHELEEFRARWRSEVGANRHKDPSALPIPPSQPPQTSPTASSRLLSSPSTSHNLPTGSSPSANANQVELPLPSIQHELSASSSALEVYTAATEKESSGQLGEAVRLYQRAFRMDDNIDRVYNALKRRADLLPAAHPPPSLAESSSWSTPPEPAPFVFKTQFQREPDFDAVAEPSFNPTAELEDSFAKLGLHFESEVEGEEVLLNRLPNEVLITVLRKLGSAGDWTSIARFALVSKKAFLLSKEQTIWREVCALTFVPPFQVEPEVSFASLARLHKNDFREMWIRQPRVRLDGIYISVCHYLRSGENDNAWVDSTHLITYHRLLRFFKDGTVLSLLSTEHPSVLVPLLTPSLRMKGLHTGFWSIAPPSDPSSTAQKDKPSGPRINIHSLVEPDSINETRPLKYTFQMKLKLGGPRGRWNKLDFSSYKSLNLGNGEELDIRLFNQKSFFFSKVRSFPPFG